MAGDFEDWMFIGACGFKKCEEWMLNTNLDPKDNNLVIRWCNGRCVPARNLIRSGIVLLDD